MLTHARKFAALHPQARVVGTDLAFIQPDKVPQNVRFLVDDVNDAWPDDEKWNLIHCCGLDGGVKDWPSTIAAMHCALKVGGYVEIHNLSAFTLNSMTAR